jgi:hypothetical protein
MRRSRCPNIGNIEEGSMVKV